ncbi:hypothetical protein [Rubrivivax gelatinosus]|uniref:hypothetical protein n=1 Tax=Rubrivivax gelatinosus TaxID=28068 RepID=UPI0005C20459|nr:hypothetical protein [Rubrivivax gelatinosus]MBG6083031.1 hypothetical protein [Rubrivivax gelatinosus]
MLDARSAQRHELAAQFAVLLRLTLTDEEFAEVLLRNRAQTDPQVCASHDFCDANMVMFEAFRRVYGRDPALSSDDGDSAEAELSNWDTEDWNAAWELARGMEFDAGRLGDCSRSA